MSIKEWVAQREAQKKISESEWAYQQRYEALKEKARQYEAKKRYLEERARLQKLKRETLTGAPAVAASAYRRVKGYYFGPQKKKRVEVVRIAASRRSARSARPRYVYRVRKKKPEDPFERINRALGW